MVKKSKNQKVTRITNDHSAGMIAFEYYQKILQFQQSKANFEKLKNRINSLFEEYFQARGTKKMVFESDDESLDGGIVTVTRVQKTSINWDVHKLKKSLGRKIFNQIVHKEYKIIDMQGLVRYLKSCGVDPVVFKKYISVSVKVDESEIDRLSEIGMIDYRDVADCYTVEKAKPYFKYTYKSKNE